jgi:hypothetical protein
MAFALTGESHMKTMTLISSVIVALIFSVTLPAQQGPSKANDNHLGTWKLISTKYGNADKFTDYPKERRRLKMLTATQFMWMDEDMKSKKILSSASGQYSYQDTIYIETIEYASNDMQGYLGKKQSFTVKIDGDKLIQSGRLSEVLRLKNSGNG